MWRYLKRREDAGNSCGRDDEFLVFTVEAEQIVWRKLLTLKAMLHFFSQLTYDYASLSFICPPSHTSRKKSLLIFDEDIRGDRLIPSDYKINFLKDQECKLLCKKAWSVEDAIQVSDLISNNYQVEWILDGLIGSTVSYTNEAPEHNYRIGFPLGFKKGENTYINNHVIFQVLYTEKGDITGFEVYPDSIAEGDCMKNSVDYEHQEVTGRRGQVIFTYSVKWKQVKNAKRWQNYIIPHPVGYSFWNGLTVDSVLCIIIGFILFKTMPNNNSNSEDIKIYDDNTEDFTGWKLIHRDVFRRPVYGGLLTPFMGTGIQLIFVFSGLICALKMNWCNPVQPGSLTRWFTLLFLLGSVPGSYWSARMYKVFRGKSWVLNSILVNMIAWTHKSSLAISLSGWLSLLSVWFFCLLPLTYLGAYFGEKADRIEQPSRITQIPRLIPSKNWYQLNIIRAILGGIIPFSIIFLNWHNFLVSITRGEFAMSIEDTIWNSILMIIAVSEITVIFIFLQLCSEDHQWWWSCFMIGASPIIYLFGVCTGTIGFISTYLMIRRIYSTVKSPTVNKHNDVKLLIDKFLKHLDGREKSMKIIQYFLKVILLYRPRPFIHNLTNQLSLTRQLLSLGTAIDDFHSLQRQPTNLFILNRIVNAIADDIYCLCRIIQPRNKRLQHYAALIAAYCWFMSILVNLKRQMREWSRDRMNKVTVLKSIADLVFCGCDIFHPSCHGQLQAWSGLISGLLAGYKMVLV
ncbi:Endomembrane protein 70-domain-containing protein [Cokeromyces recurvatus]|uniref:Endomembrane protein 70-domain-containing protein n=1 Tax=Cokeromyces recurvatus TaxID=90255 RepID=UPI002220D581|nr:Endomembrane protein 70-domain-containing protein [Cokeromyces recurvatus]KAI7900122.1 Endomembrane protein 70-domain-containing protein [Cokeromyces recurvatus]